MIEKIHTNAPTTVSAAIVSRASGRTATFSAAERAPFARTKRAKPTTEMARTASRM
jgi:hypothetical protein